jgi:hypothetical protein
MNSELLTLFGIAAVMAVVIGTGIVRTLRMEDDEHPKDREKGLAAFAKANGFTFSAQQNMLAQSRLPALRLFAHEGTIAHHVMTRDDGAFDTMIFDLGYQREAIGVTLHNHSHDRAGSWGSDWGRQHYDGDDDGIRIDITGGSIVLVRTVFAFRKVRAAMPELVVDRQHRKDLEKIPATLRAGFEKVWCAETGEDWIVFHRQLVRAQSTKELAIADAFAAAEELRDAILAHWGLI